MIQKEDHLRGQAETVCNSIAFWEKKIIAATESDPASQEELSYLFAHLDFDMLVMEKLDKECQTLQKERNSENDDA